MGVEDETFTLILGPLSSVESVSGLLHAVLVLNLFLAMDGHTTAALGDWNTNFYLQK